MVKQSDARFFCGQLFFCFGSNALSVLISLDFGLLLRLNFESKIESAVILDVVVAKNCVVIFFYLSTLIAS